MGMPSMACLCATIGKPVVSASTALILNPVLNVIGTAVINGSIEGFHTLNPSHQLNAASAGKFFEDRYTSLPQI